MNHIFKVFRYAGLCLVIIAITSITSFLFTAYGKYKEGLLLIKVVENNAQHGAKIINGNKFISSNIGTYEIKPTLAQAIILCDDGIGQIGASIFFYLILGIIILVLAYRQPQWFESFDENRLWQIVGLGGLFVLE